MLVFIIKGREKKHRLGVRSEKQQKRPPATTVGICDGVPAERSSCEGIEARVTDKGLTRIDRVMKTKLIV